MEDAHNSPNVLSFTCAIEVGIRSESDGVNRCPFGCGHCHGHCQACLWATEWGEALRLLQRMQQRSHRVYLKCFWHLKSCEAVHENHEIIYIYMYICVYVYMYIYILSLRVEIPEIYVQTLEFDSPSFFCSFRCPCRFCSHSQAQSTNGIRGANLCTCSVANVVSEIYWHLVFVCLEEVWQHFIHQPWRQQKTKLLIILKYNLI